MAAWADAVARSRTRRIRRMEPVLLPCRTKKKPAVPQACKDVPGRRAKISKKSEAPGHAGEELELTILDRGRRSYGIVVQIGDAKEITDIENHIHIGHDRIAPLSRRHETEVHGFLFSATGNGS